MSQQRCILARGGLWLGICVLALVIWPKTVCAVVIASDNADPNDPAYADGWTNGDNGGFGFGPWTGLGGFVTQIDTANDSYPDELPHPNNNLATPAFAFGAEGNFATRPFANPMAAGQTFKMNFDQYPYDPADPPDGAYVEQDSLLRFSSAGGERIALYNWWGKYTFGGSTIVYNADEWGIGADSAFDNLNGGAALPMSGGLFKPNYTGPDSTDGFSLTLDIVTIDTYRLRIVDDNVTKVDVTGALRSTSGNPPVSITGQGIDSIGLWFTGGDYNAGFPIAYFNNLTIETSAAPAVPGDYDNNGKVDAGDYVTWRKNELANAPLPNDNGLTTQAARYALWRSRFGNPPGSGSMFGGSIPEPSSCLLLILGLIALACHRRAH